MHRRREIVLVATILAIGLFVRVYRIGNESPWYDETVCLLPLADSHGLPEYLTEVRRLDLTMTPGYFVLAYGWHLLVGREVLPMRLLSVTMSMASMALVYALARRLLGSAYAWLPLLLMALSPSHVYYAQEIRMYSLVILLGAVIMYSAIVYLDTHKRAYLWINLAACLWLMWTHLFGSLLVAAIGPFVLTAWRRDRQAVLVWILGVLASTYGLMMWLAGAGIDGSSTNPASAWRLGLSWIPPLSMDSLIILAANVCGSFHTQVDLVNSWVLTAACVAACFAALPLYRARNRTLSAVLVACIVVPLAGIVFISLAILPAMLGRYMLFASTSVFIFYGVTLSRCTGRWLKVAFVVFAVAPYIVLATNDLRHRPIRADIVSAVDAYQRCNPSAPLFRTRASMSNEAMQYLLTLRPIEDRVFTDGSDTAQELVSRSDQGKESWFMIGEEMPNVEWTILGELYLHRVPFELQEFPSSRGNVKLYHIPASQPVSVPAG